MRVKKAIIPAAGLGTRVLPISKSMPKEMLNIVIPEEKKDAVLEAIRNLPCLSQPGSGICFCSEIEDFHVLGKK